MAKGSRNGKSDKAQYKYYKDTDKCFKNKVRKLEARVRKNPNDSGAQKRLDELMTNPSEYTRNKFKHKGWFHPQEQALLKKTGHEVHSIALDARDKLAKLRSVYSNDRPSAIIGVEPVKGSTLVVDQLFNIGLINEKRRNSIKSRMGRVRKGRTVSNRR